MMLPVAAWVAVVAFVSSRHPASDQPLSVAAPEGTVTALFAGVALRYSVAVVLVACLDPLLKVTVRFQMAYRFTVAPFVEVMFACGALSVR